VTSSQTLSIRERLGLYAQLTKARLASLVLMTTLAAYLAAHRGPFDPLELILTMLGTAACAFAANAFNQIWERDRDALMERTRHRPLPSGRLGLGHALGVASGLLVVGQLILFTGTNALTALLALSTVLIYVLLYTPLKTRSSLNTLVGAVCGALPPMLGWTAAAGRLEGGAWLLGLLLFLWQIPHFLALAWLYREDYARGGFRMLAISDPGGQLTGAMTVLYSIALLPLGIAFSMAGLAGPGFVTGYLLLMTLLLALSLRLWRRLDRRSARQLFLASVIVLPLSLILLLVDPSAPDRDPAARGDWPAHRADADSPAPGSP
jgi:heme o synthase